MSAYPHDPAFGVPRSALTPLQPSPPHPAYPAQPLPQAHVPQAQPALPQAQVAPPPYAAQAPLADRPTRATSSRTARVALVLSAFVAVAGVSFAVGRLSVDDGMAMPPGMAGAAAGNTSPQVGSGRGSSFDMPAAPELAAAAAAGDEDGQATTTTQDPGTAQEASAAQDPGTAQRPGFGDANGGQPEGMPGMGGPGGFDGAPPGNPGGGLEGTVSELTDTELSLTLADGSTQTVAIDATTAWAAQLPISAADVAPGDTVSVQLPFTGFGPGAGSTEPAVAVQVTLTPPAF